MSVDVVSQGTTWGAGFPSWDPVDPLPSQPVVRGRPLIMVAESKAGNRAASPHQLYVKERSHARLGRARGWMCGGFLFFPRAPQRRRAVVFEPANSTPNGNTDWPGRGLRGGSRRRRRGEGVLITACGRLVRRWTFLKDRSLAAAYVHTNGDGP